MTRIMLDIETLGQNPGCVVLSIGAVAFDETGPLDHEFEKAIDVTSCKEAGLTADPETAQWWAKQSYEARQEAFGGSVPLDLVLEEFARFCNLGRGWTIWANSPSFDCRILAAAYKAVGKSVPWDYWQERDHRTLSELLDVSEPKREGTHHSALDDAKHQARVAATCLQQLGRGGTP